MMRIKGAELEIYNYRNDKVKKIQPQPSEDDCDLLDKIKPSAGRLLILEMMTQVFML